MRSIGVLKNGGLKAAYVIRATSLRARRTLLEQSARPDVRRADCPSDRDGAGRGEGARDDALPCSTSLDADAETLHLVIARHRRAKRRRSCERLWRGSNPAARRQARLNEALSPRRLPRSFLARFARAGLPRRRFAQGSYKLP